MSDLGVSSVKSSTQVLQNLLGKARDIKPSGSIEPALNFDDLKEGFESIRSLLKSLGNNSYAATETAVRSIFYKLLASASIDDPGFGQVWNLLDIVTLISDIEYCEPGLVFWLVEELLESQTIEACRIVFDYLDSRRERLTAKHFEKKNLIILRACNDLLRRLSRAEDTVFCGRVFIFLFQSFPLGDRSSVNLRGEYHVENITSYEAIEPQVQDEPEGMVLDVAQPAEDSPADTKTSDTEAKDTFSRPTTPQPSTIARTVQIGSLNGNEEASVPDMDALYAIFWSLQEYFSQPTRLFESKNLEAFKSGLQATMSKFKEVQQEQLDRGTSKVPIESKRGIKRKRLNQNDDLVSSFNPKYLTSRDLFELEVSDLSFRRHILVQALILIDLLLSLTPKAKKKLEHTSNKSVLYSYVLGDDQAKWASNARVDIATYLQQGPEGKFYYRMVDTVLSRDKNWVHWKAESCPPIGRSPVSAADFAGAKKAAQRVCAPRRMRPTVLGALDLSFLTGDKGVDGMDKFKDPSRFTLPPIESFKGPIMREDFEIEMAKDDAEKRAAQERRASKLWRTLRIASRGKLSVFDQIDDGSNMKPLFEPETGEAEAKAEMNRTDENAEPLAKEDGKVAESHLVLTAPSQEVPPAMVVS